MYSLNFYSELIASPISSTKSDDGLNDSWLVKSLQRSENSDPNYDASKDQEDLNIVLPKTFDESQGRIILVYESKLLKLLSRCLSCGSVVHEIKECKKFGMQYKVKMECLEGCSTSWCAQPEMESVTGNMIYTFIFYV